MSPFRAAILYPSKGGCRARPLLQRVDTWGKRQAVKGVGAKQKHPEVGYEGVAGGGKRYGRIHLWVHMLIGALESSVTSAGQCKMLVATSHGGGGGKMLFSRKHAHGGDGRTEQESGFSPA